MKPQKDGKYPDGLGVCYAGGKGNPKFAGKSFVILGNIADIKPSNVVDWVVNDLGEPRFQFTLILEGQDSVQMPIQFKGIHAEQFLGIKPME